ncbi:hypothetical protein SUDANB6_02202 [Streptomyces sp. enrichment culture]
MHLAVHEENEVLHIGKVESRYPVRMYSRIGKPVAVTADELLTLLPLVRRTADAISDEYSGRTPAKEVTT